jgi:hypothetical protein
LSKGKEKAYMPIGGEEEAHAMLRLSIDGDEEDAGLQTVPGTATGMSRMQRRTMMEWIKEEVLTMTPGRWVDLRNLLLEVSILCRE